MLLIIILSYLIYMIRVICCKIIQYQCKVLQVYVNFYHMVIIFLLFVYFRYTSLQNAMTWFKLVFVLEGHSVHLHM